MKVQFNKIHHLTGHQSSIFALCKHKSDHQFITGDGSGYAVQWDLKNTKESIVLAKADSNIFALHYLDEFDILLIGTMSGHIYFIDVTEKKLIAELEPNCKAVFDFWKIDDLIYAGTESGTLLVLDIKNRNIKTQYKLSEKSLRSIQYYPSQHHLIIGSSDHHIYRFDLTQHKIISTLAHHRNSVFAVHCLNDGKMTSYIKVCLLIIIPSIILRFRPVANYLPLPVKTKPSKFLTPPTFNC